ncbi:MAG: hypothetical protein ACYDBT_02825 [Desulfobulbaceae bacterium]
MEYTIRPMAKEDREPLIDIFNYYVENSFAAYPEHKLPYQAFAMFLQIADTFPAGTIGSEWNHCRFRDAARP